MQEPGLFLVGADSASLNGVGESREGWIYSKRQTRNFFDPFKEFVKLVQKFYIVRDSLILYGDIIMYESQLFIPKVLRSKYSTLCHEGHQGTSKYQRRARQTFWWPGRSIDIEELIKCDICTKHSRTKPINIIKDYGLPDGPWLELGSDTLELKGQWILLVVRYYTAWIDVRPLLSLSSYTVIL